MRVQHPEQDSKKGAALIMVMLSGMLIVILGIGMLFFYQKQVERRMKLEFDIHRRLAAKSGFNLVQYPGVQNVLATNGVATYVYSVAPNRPVILVTVGEAEPIYTEDFSEGSLTTNWTHSVEAGFSVAIAGLDYVFKTSAASTNVRTELIFEKEVNVAWNTYPFGLCYEVFFRNTDAGNNRSTNYFPWAGYVFVGASNDLSQMFTTNLTASLSISGVVSANETRCQQLYEHSENTAGLPLNSEWEVTEVAGGQMNLATELILDGNHLAMGMQSGGAGFIYRDVQIHTNFCDVTNVVLGVGGFNQNIATNFNLNLSRFKVRNPYEYEIYLSWTNRNRYFGTTNTMYTTNVLATVVDKTTVGNQYYIFDSFETVVP